MILEMERKIEKMMRFLNNLSSKRRIIVAYSGGVDSSLLLYLYSKLDINDKIAFLIDSPLFSDKKDIDEVKSFVEKVGVKFLLFRLPIPKEEEFLSNTPLRCYYCKRGEYRFILDKLKRIDRDTIIDGVNSSDLNDFRPGIRASDELGVIHPFIEMGWGKRDIRLISDYFNLPTSDKPSSPCLASRIAYGTRITLKRIKMVEEGEDILKNNGFNKVRVRLYSFKSPSLNNEMGVVYLARIEVPRERIKELVEKVDLIKDLKETGFDYVTIDPEGFRSGSMNEYFFKQK